MTDAARSSIRPALPPRLGARPTTTPHAPHSQIDQVLPLTARRELSRLLVAQLCLLDDVRPGTSHRAPPGTVGLHLDPHCARADEQAFLLGQEFAQIHVEDDGSLHAILPESLRSAAMEAGWVEPHPFAGQPTVSPDTVMIYAPRDTREVLVVAELVRCSWENARG